MELRQRKPVAAPATAAGGDERIQVERPAERPVERKKRRKARRRLLGPCILFSSLFLLTVLGLFGGRIWRWAKSSVVRGYVQGWSMDESLRDKSAALAKDDILEHFNTRCRLPYYPDGLRAAPRKQEFMRRFWVSARKALLLTEVGTALWTSAAVSSSVDSLTQAVKDAGVWTLHFAHSNRTELEHHAHLEQVLNPADPLEAPFADFAIPAAPADIPHFWVPSDPAASTWTVSLVPALSGQSPKQTFEPFYLVVLAGSIRLIAYSPGYAFTIHDDHVWGWHENQFELVRKSGNHGEMCLVEADQAVLIPERWGYSILALDNSVLLRIPIDKNAKEE